MARPIGWAAVSLVVFACGGAVEEKDDSTGAGGTTGGQGGTGSGEGGTAGGGGSGVGAAGSDGGGDGGITIDPGPGRPHPACRQPPDPGSCPGSITRYYFDAGTGRCQVFTYSGCGGNDNNFSVFERCERICLDTNLSCDCSGPSSSGCSFDPDCSSCPIDLYAAGGCTATGLRCSSGNRSCTCVTIGNDEVWQCGSHV